MSYVCTICGERTADNTTMVIHATLMHWGIEAPAPDLVEVETPLTA